MTNRSRYLFVFFIAVLLVSFHVGSRATSADSEYNPIGVRAGVWNDGQAALWDLHIIDHYRWSGQEERARGYKPEQPIAFSHVTHVQKMGVDCQFCHWTVAKSDFAAIPEVETCNGCHKPGMGINAGTDESQKEKLKKLSEYFENFQAEKPIPWEKVHVMPDYVRFNHKRHVKAGVGCHECHGQIPEMEQVERVSSMKMGWCMDCHRQAGTSIDCYVCHK